MKQTIYILTIAVSISLASLLLISKLIKDINAAVPQGCKVCREDAYGAKYCASSGSSCDPQSNECGTDADCQSGGGGGEPDDIINTGWPCTYCDPFMKVCDTNAQPCTEYQCVPGTRCAPEDPPQDFGNCNSDDGFPWCLQTEDGYDTVYIDGCNDPAKNYLCGQSSLTAIWCKYSNGLCDVKAEMEAGSFDYGNNKLCYSSISDLNLILNRKKYEGDYETKMILHAPGDWMTKDEMVAYFKANPGSVMIASGEFRPEGSNLDDPIKHHTLITGIDEKDGKFIHHDSYFNCNNEGEVQICDDKLEDHMETYNVIGVIIVSPPDGN